MSESLVQYDEIYAEWAPNEKVATEVAIGASIAGVRSMCCMKHVGVNVAADPLYTAAYAGVRGGMVVIAADDPGMYSSQNEQDTRMVARAAMLPVLEPSDSAEAKEFTKYAFDLREKYDTPVIVRSTTRLSHSQGLVEPVSYTHLDVYKRQVDIQQPCGGGLGDIAVSLASELHADEILDA